MYLEFDFGTQNIGFNVTFKNRKTMEIAVEAPNTVTVVAPFGTSQELILKKVWKKAKWIVQKIFYYKDLGYISIKREFVNGESFMYLGRNYSTQIVLDSNCEDIKVGLNRGKFIVTTKEENEDAIREAFRKWYYDKAKEFIGQRIKYYEAKIKHKPKGIMIKDQKKRWGSCTINDVLLFNWRCIMAPANVVDYIIVHEMSHLVEKNHSKKFWDVVESVLPDYRARKEWLKKFGVRLDL